MHEQNIQSPHLRKILSALQFQGGGNNCGPYTTATVINGLLGQAIDPARLAFEMNRPAWRPPLLVIRRIPNWATFPWGMVDVFKNYHLDSSWKFFGSVNDLKQGIREGRIQMPVIGCWKPLWAHVMVLLAWDSISGWGFANTQYPEKTIYWVPEETFKDQWWAMGNLFVEISPSCEGFEENGLFTRKP